MRARIVSNGRSEYNQRVDTSGPAVARKGTTYTDPTASQCRHLFAFLLIFRLLNAAMIQTFFNPDEYWQSVEVAHRLVFGYGYLTWEWERGLRGYFHPLIFAALFKGLAMVGLDSPFLLRLAPRLLQGAFAAVGDLFLYLLALQTFDCRRTSFWTLFCHVTNWFTFFCLPRTFSSSTETVLVIIALYYWTPLITPKKIMKKCHEKEEDVKEPRKEHEHGIDRNREYKKEYQKEHKKEHQKEGKEELEREYKGEEDEEIMIRRRRRALWLAAIACVVRPTTAILWIYVGIADLMNSINPWRIVFREVVPIGAFVIGISSLIDRYMYGRWEIVALNFLRFNVIEKGGSVYGTHPFFWYFTHGFPPMLLTFLPLLFAGIVWSRERHLAGVMTWTLTAYSWQAHKEFRFVLPVLPLALMYCGRCLAVMESWQTKRKEEGEEDGDVARPHWSLGFKALIVLLVVTQLGPAIYFSTVHQRGSVAVMSCLEKEARVGNVSSIHFLMPCHSTPFYSHVHHNVSMTILDCSPHSDFGHVSESQKFLADPLAFFEDRYNKNLGNAKPGERPPSHLVLFDIEEKKLKGVLMDAGYMEICKYHHAHFPVDRELQESVVVYIKQ